MSENKGSNDSKKVRIFKPRALILGFHGVISPIDWEDTCILPYIRQHLKEYIEQHWNNPTISQIIPRLRQESFDQHFVYENSECPLIDDDDDDRIPEQILSVNDFLIWQMDNKKETRDSQRIFRLVWMDGLNKRGIRVPIFSDVVPALRQFKNKYHIKIALFSSSDAHICRQLFENTTEGDISQYFDDYFDNKTGDPKDVESYKKMVKQLQVEPKDILYVIDYGQSAKCAKQLEDTNGTKGANGTTSTIQCLLIIRPNNRKIREYYLLRFSHIYSLLDIEFVLRQ